MRAFNSDPDKSAKITGPGGRIGARSIRNVPALQKLCERPVNRLITNETRREGAAQRRFLVARYVVKGLIKKERRKGLADARTPATITPGYGACFNLILISIW